jgi:hypothetical protein
MSYQTLPTAQAVTIPCNHIMNFYDMGGVKTT